MPENPSNLGNKIREITEDEQRDATMRAAMDKAWAKHKAGTLAPSSPGPSNLHVVDFRAMSPPIKAPPTAKPPPPELQAANSQPPPIKVAPSPRLQMKISIE